MRVLLACDFHQKYAANLSAGLSSLGCEVTLLTRDHDLEFGGGDGVAAAYVSEVAGGSVDHLRLAGRMRDVGELPNVVRTRGAVRSFAPDVVHFQDHATNDLRLIAAARARPGRYALTVHDPAPHPGDDEGRLVGAAARRALVRRAGLIFVHADVLRDELVELEHPRAPIVVVPHGSPPPEPQPLPDRPRLLFFGRIKEYKGLDTLLDAMPLVWRRRPDVELEVAGTGDIPVHPVLSDTRVFLREEYVPDDELPAMYTRCTAVVLPYRQASQSGVGALGKHYGRPLVATSVGGLPDLVGQGGIVVPPEDAPALADALVDLAERPECAESLGRVAAEEVVSESSWERVAELTVEAYERYLR